MRYTDPNGKWVKPGLRGFRLMCCDCKLIHDFTFKVIQSGRGLGVKFQAFRNVRATAAARRKYKK